LQRLARKFAIKGRVPESRATNVLPHVKGPDTRRGVDCDEKQRGKGLPHAKRIVPNFGRKNIRDPKAPLERA